jgi:hypothetical protein
MILEPNDALVCILDDDVPDLAGIAWVGVKGSRARRGHVKGAVSPVLDAPKIHRDHVLWRMAGVRAPR